MLSMLLRLLSLNPQRVIVGMILASAIGWGSLSTARLHRAQARIQEQSQIITQLTAEVAGQAQAMEASHAYQQDLADLDARRRAADRVRPPACVSSATARLNAAAATAGRTVQNADALRRDLLDFARDAEADALRLQALQKLCGGE